MCHFGDFVGTKETAGAKRSTAEAEKVVFQSADLPFSAIYGHNYRFLLNWILCAFKMAEQLNFSSIVFSFDVGRRLWTNMAPAHRRV
jgi:hypothetical protein